jgi:short-subunit dehydrogenase
VAVANAGVAHYGRFDSLEPDLAERMTRVNWLGTLHTAAAVLPGMLERGSGHLVIVSSGAGYRAFPEAAVYGGTKAAQRAFGEALRHELAGSGVSVTVVYPGEIATALHDHEKGSMPDWYRTDGGADPAELAKRVVEAVANDSAAVHYPPMVAALRITHGLSPRVADFVLRLARGGSVAPRRG